jgi:hypothetical protein
MNALQILPGTGRGTMHSMVEGLPRLLCRRLRRAARATSQYRGELR